jgi:hypothetical protein
LANLKSESLGSDDEEAMARQLRAPDAADDDRLQLNYALGKALEDRCEFAASFEHYATGAKLRRATVPYDAAAMARLFERVRRLFTRPFFSARADQGADSEAPIFIVGLPRSGSTLVEQILASHPAVEGTIELPDITAMAIAVGGYAEATDDSRYPDRLADLDAAEIADLGEDYLRRTRIHRKLGRLRFIDKMPNNFRYIGFIHLILPRARIIDARRHPMAAGFSCFKQHFARGHNYSYDLSEIGEYYRLYTELMTHFDAVLPGRIHRVIYEDMVEDTEAEVRRLLDYLGLPFEDACLRFHENDRAVRTASSEQVRRPIYREGLDHWRNFEPWLGPLKEALGSTLESWRGRNVGG